MRSHTHDIIGNHAFSGAGFVDKISEDELWAITFRCSQMKFMLGQDDSEFSIERSLHFRLFYFFKQTVFYIVKEFCFQFRMHLFIIINNIGFQKDVDQSTGYLVYVPPFL